jgi:hypothetical protein
MAMCGWARGVDGARANLHTSVHRDLRLHGLADVAARADAVGLVVAAREREFARELWRVWG